MNDAVLGEAMEQNRTVSWILLGFAVIMVLAAAPTAQEVVVGATGWSGVVALGVMAAMALGVLWLRWALLNIRVHVGPEAVTRTWRGEVKHVLRYADITGVRLRRNHRVRAWMLTMDGPDPYGRPQWFTVSTMYARNLGLLLTQVDREVARRPELLAEHEQVTWVSYPR
ncbi:MAG: hypothetical protein ACI379_01580 [Nocardioides sp.]|uniref:hypothetical protein n=1 Tax=Nocardioides sp. TaxID=35761 RepID=UPI003F0F55F7